MAVILGHEAINRRLYWIDELVNLSGNFGADFSKVEEELSTEIKKEGLIALLDHLRLCTSIPESYGHDSSEEKLYSKYTDALISEAFSFLGLNSIVITERADVADVEVVSDNFSFVADAKVFRLSRTAKNQKDFKVQAMDRWKHGKRYAMVVCPLYQLPTRASQIYEQAATRNVCIFSYSHLAILAQLAENQGGDVAKSLLHEVFKTVEAMNPSKDASLYWQALNRTILEFDQSISNIWRQEKIAIIEGIEISKQLGLKYLASEREKIMKLSHKEAISRLVVMHKIDNRIEQIKKVSNNALI